MNHAIDDMQYSFMPGCDTKDSIFILRQMQEKYIGKNIKAVPCLCWPKKGLLCLSVCLSALVGNALGVDKLIVLEALSPEFHTGWPWKLLYADDLVIMAGSEEELRVKLKLWKLT